MTAAALTLSTQVPVNALAGFNIVEAAAKQSRSNYDVIIKHNIETQGRRNPWANGPS